MGGPTSVKLRNRDLHVRVLAASGCIDHGRPYLVNSGNGKSVTEGDARRPRTTRSELVAAVVAIIDRHAQQGAALRVRDELDGLTWRRCGATRLERDTERQRVEAPVTTCHRTGQQSREDPRHQSHAHKDRSRAVSVKDEFRAAEGSQCATA